MPLENVVYIGTYTKALSHTAGNAEGIYICRFDPGSGALAVEKAVGVTVNPSYLALDPQGRYLYAVEEIDDAAVVVRCVRQIHEVTAAADDTTTRAANVPRGEVGNAP